MRAARPLFAVLAFLLTLALCACGGYADFELPGEPGSPGNLRFEWRVRPEPVLGRGPDAWDSGDVLNPSVVRFESRLLNLYSGFDGRVWHTGAATSRDGLAWSKQGLRLSPDPRTWEGGYIAANGSALVRGQRVWYWYQAGDPPRIGLATSDGASNWQKHPGPVLEPGPTGSWDERGLGDPYVIAAGTNLFLFYTGMDRARRQRLGIAKSADGIHWTRLRANPILEIGPDGAFDENGLGEPAVWTSHGRYWMLYTGRDRHEIRRIGLAESADGVRWSRSARAPVFAGAEAWNNKVVCDPSVLPAPGGVHVWFGGGSVPRPDERINGQIGYAFLAAVER
jgi:predicted GH43/DUF377 family glycosyl hydrolase